MLLRNISGWLRQCLGLLLPLLFLSAINHQHEGALDADHCVLCTSVGPVRRRETPPKLLPERNVAGGSPGNDPEFCAQVANSALTRKCRTTICLPQMEEQPPAGVLFGVAAFILPTPFCAFDFQIQNRRSKIKNLTLVARRAPPKPLRPRGPPLL